MKENLFNIYVIINVIIYSIISQKENFLYKDAYTKMYKDNKF